MGLGGDALEIVARVDYRTLDEFEQGFSDRLGAEALFLSRHHIVTPAQDIPVGTAVRISIALPTGDRALALDGTVAWAYPRDRVPPGREAGVGVRIDTIAAEATERVARMRKRPSAGTRVRAPGERLLARAARIPAAGPAFASLARTLETVADPAPAPPAPSAEPPRAARSALDVLHPPAPTPRVMGLLVDQTFDPTPPPQPLPAFQDSHPPRPLPLPPEMADTLPPAPPLAELPDAPAHQPAGAFDERRTDVDLLGSLASVDLVALDGDEARSALLSEAAAPPVAPPPALSPRLADADPTGAFKLDDLPSADAELMPEANAALVEETLGGDAGELEPVTAEAEPLPLPSSQEWEARTEHGQGDLPSTAEAVTTSEAERSAIPRPLPPPDPWPAWPAPSTAPMGTAFLVSFRRRDPVAAVEVFTWPTHTTKRVGKFELARDDEPEAPPAPAANAALEEATVDGFERGVTDPALSFAGVLERVDRAVEQAARDADESVPSAEASSVPAASASTPAIEDSDSVFASGPAVVRPAMPLGKQAAVDASPEGADVTSDELRRPGYVEEDADTDLDLVRPNLAGRLSRR